MPPQTSDTTSEPSAIVAIGASAGGLSALEEFFAAVPSKTGFAFVVIQHLSPDFKSLMEDLLARHTNLAIKRVSDGMPLSPDTVFLIPPKTEMTLDGTVLHLRERINQGSANHPIDIFFESLAQAPLLQVAVVLSGTGSDGSQGIEHIDNAGGMVFAQDPESAEFPGMPEAAINTNVVRQFASPGKLPQLILNAVLHPNENHGESPASAILSEQSSMDKVLALLNEKTNIDFQAYKIATIHRRIERRMSLSNIHNFDDYLSILSGSNEELNILLNDLLIGVTGFWRDREAFDQLRNNWIPALIKKKNNHDEIRIWSAGCASGEEAYSLAMIFHEACTAHNFNGSVRIFATDVHQPTLERASHGHYSHTELEALPDTLKNKYTIKISDRTARVSQEIRDMVVFAPHNVLTDPPFTRLDLISCRNMIIYLVAEAQSYALSVFRYCLNLGGLFFQGASESLGEMASDFKTLDSRWKIHEKIQHGPLPIPGRRYSSLQGRSLKRKQSIPAQAPEPRLLHDYELLLRQSFISGYLVTANRNLLHIFGEANQWLQHRDGRVSDDLSAMLPEELSLTASTLIQRAAMSKQVVHCEGVTTSTQHGEFIIDLSATPLPDPSGASEPHVLLALRNTQPSGIRPEASPKGEKLSANDAIQQRVSDLEIELLSTKENLQATIEELQTTNEELQSTNEELQSANEELQSSNEELHSVNEELYTVNSEYEHKNRMLTALNRDHRSLLDATDVGIIFLDEEQNIRRYNASSLRWFRLMPQDIGRPLSHIVNDIINPEALKRIIEECKANDKAYEERLDLGEKQYVLGRVLPYYNDAGSFEGAILTCTDISNLLENQQKD